MKGNVKKILLFFYKPQLVFFLKMIEAESLAMVSDEFVVLLFPMPYL